MKKIYIIILLSIFYNFSFAQSDCTETLREAKDTYDAGNLDAVKEMLYPCLSDFNKNEKVEAYKLIALTFLFDDKIGEARAAMYELLKVDPEFAINDVIDPVELKDLHNDFKTNPIYSIGISGGINSSKIRLIETYGIDNFENKGSYSSNGVGYQFGIHGSVIIIPKLYVNVEALFKGTKYQYFNNFDLNNLSYNNDGLSSLGEITAQENHTWLSIPLSLTYDIPIKGKVSTFARLGANTNLLFTAQSTYNRTYDEQYSLAPVTGVPVDMKNNRYKFNYWLTGGAGLKYKITKGSLFLDIRYNYGIRNANNPDNRYSTPELMFKYFYVDDDFKLNDLAISVGYSRHFYNPALKDKEKNKEFKENKHAMDKNQLSKDGKVKDKSKGTRYKKFD